MKALEKTDLDSSIHGYPGTAYLTWLFLYECVYNGSKTMLPDTTREKLLMALDSFDSHLRHSEQWQGWDSNQAQRYAIYHDGKYYPPKRIISIATNTPVSQFSGGQPTNSYLKHRGFTIVTLKHGGSAAKAIPAADVETPSVEKDVSATPHHWLFQSDPNHFDLPGAAAILAKMHWLVKQHKSHIQPNDRVYLWETGKNAALIAVATVLDLPALHEESAEVKFFI